MNASLLVSAEHWPVNTLTGVRQRGAAVCKSKQGEIIKERSFQPLDLHTKIEAAGRHVREAISRSEQAAERGPALQHE